jgi:membrane protease YdiL (CAAX protease family)
MNGATRLLDARVESALRGFGPLGLLAILAILAASLVTSALGAVLALGWARMSSISVRDLGYVRPRSWIRTVASGVLFGAAFKLVMKAIVMPLFGAPAINPTYHYVAGNAGALPAILAAVIIGAGFGEETVFRGYMFERLGKLFGSGAAAKAAIVLLTSAVFALAHYHDQGIAGSEQAAITGFVFGAIFARTKQIWIPMIAHASFDVTAVALIYWNLESNVAHLFFK